MTELEFFASDEFGQGLGPWSSIPRTQGSWSVICLSGDVIGPMHRACPKFAFLLALKSACLKGACRKVFYPIGWISHKPKQCGWLIFQNRDIRYRTRGFSPVADEMPKNFFVLAGQAEESIYQYIEMTRSKLCVGIMQSYYHLVNFSKFYADLGGMATKGVSQSFGEQEWWRVAN